MEQQQQVKHEKLLLTMEEAAQVLSLGRTLFYELVMRKEITSVKIGRVRRVPLSSLHIYVARQIEDQQ